MPLKVGNTDIDFDPGDTYLGDAPPDERHDRRAEQVKKFRDAAIQQTRAQIAQAAGACLALCMQLRIIGGNFGDTKLPQQLREIADYMEDV